jgi:hypothetical protein
MILLRRLARAAAWVDLQGVLGGSRTVLSRIFTHMLNLVWVRTDVTGPAPYPYTLTSPRDSCQLSSENLLLSLTMWKDERDDIEGIVVKFWK